MDRRGAYAPQPVVTEVDGIETRHEREGSGPPVLVLHGWGASVEAVTPIARALAAEHTVHSLDLPGFGRSALPPEAWGVPDYERFVLAFMDAVGLERADVVGHSFGGRIAIRIGADAPERVGRLVLVDSAGIRGRRGLRYHRRVAMAKLGKLAARVLGSRGRRLQERLRARAASSDYAQAGALRPTFVKVVNEDLRELLPRIAAPTLLIWGDRDTDTPLRDGRLMEELIPNAGLVVLESAGHYSYADEPLRFGRVVGHFLRPPG